MPARAKPRRLEYVGLDDLAPALANPKAHDDDLIGASIGRFGFIETPVLDERTGRLIAGHGRVDDLHRRKAAGEDPPDGIVVDMKGAWSVPVLRGWSSSSDDDAHAAGIALNRVGERGGWDAAALSEMLDGFAAIDDGLLGLGFDAADLDGLRDLAVLDLREVNPPPTFPDAEVLAGHTEYRCPSCSYEWSGSPKPNSGDNADT